MPAAGAGRQAERGVDDLNEVEDRQGMACSPESACDVKKTTWVGGNQRLRFCVDDMLGFAVGKLACRFRLDQVKYTGGAAADRSLR